MTVIRPAVLEDAHAIAHVHVESWKTTYAGIVPASVIEGLDKTFERRKNFWAKQIEDNEPDNVLFVAEDAGEIVGFVSAGESRAEVVEAYDGELYAIYLLQSAQGKGIGRKLIEACAKQLREIGFHSMFLWVLETNTESRGFYEHLGGKRVAEGTFEIAGATLKKLAYGWPDIRSLIRDES